MGVLGKINLDLIGILGLCLLLVMGNNRLTNGKEENECYRGLIQSTLFILIQEVLCQVLPMSTRSEWRILHITANVIGFGMVPIVGYLWVEYVVKYLKIKVKMNLFKIPIWINSILAILSIKYPLIFTISHDNQYTREGWFWVPIVISLFYMGASMVILFKHRYKLECTEIKMMSYFSVVPLAGMIIQVKIPQVLCVWAFVALCLVGYYIYLQDHNLRYDMLTNAWSRRAFEDYVANELFRLKKFGLISIDLDGFKQINDTYGHHEGDEALKIVVGILKDALKKRGKVVRMGGDEFLIIVDSIKRGNMQYIIDDIQSCLKIYNTQHLKPYAISWSIGYEIYTGQYESIEEILEYIDQCMYKQKGLKKKP
ncbi:MAG: GGDEF domain-containing protein [Cellulosilyticaceae bacterium]